MYHFSHLLIITCSVVSNAVEYLQFRCHSDVIYILLSPLIPCVRTRCVKELLKLPSFYFAVKIFCENPWHEILFQFHEVVQKNWQNVGLGPLCELLDPYVGLGPLCELLDPSLNYERPRPENLK